MKIRKTKNVAGKVRWQLDLGMVRQADGSSRRVQECYRTQEEAKASMATAKDKRQAHGDAAISLTEDERVRFAAARDRLVAAGGSIEAAVELFLKHSKAVREPLSLIELLSRCIDAKAQIGASVRYLQQFRCSCMNFIRGREDQQAHTVTREDVRKWVLGAGWAPKTQRVYLGDLRALFAWGLTERHMAENPAAGDKAERIALARLDDTPISRLSSWDVHRILWRLCSRKEGEDYTPLLWYFVLGTFAGIRPTELEKMDRSSVILKERHATVDAALAKTRRRRVVDLTPQACAWLQLDQQHAGPVIPVNFVRRWRRLRKALGLIPWPHDVMRHTFASMHYASHQDEALLKAQMGHSAAENTLMRHYRALVSRKEAEFFWSFAPSKRRT